VSRATALYVVVIAAIGLAWAMPLASVGCAQSAHYAATRSIAEGHPYIDRYANTTCDLVRTNGHYYAAKGPALELWSAPFYLLLRSFGAVPANPNAHLSYPDAMAGIPLRAVWQIGLWAVVLPAIGLLLLIRRAVEWIEPGLGTAAAAILGLATLVLPFYAIRQAPRLRRLALFAAGGLVGLLPLLAFDTWAFGNPLRLAYAGTPGQVQPAAGRPRGSSAKAFRASAFWSSCC